MTAMADVWCLGTRVEVWDRLLGWRWRDGEVYPWIGWFMQMTRKRKQNDLMAYDFRPHYLNAILLVYQGKRPD